MVTSSTLQSLNKFKTVYLTTLIGYVLNALLDVPFMLVVHHLGFEPFIGAVFASIIGYSFSAFSALFILKKDHHLKYRETFKMFGKIIVPTVVMILVVFLLKTLIPLNIVSKTSCIIYVAIISIVGAIVYIFVAYKQGILSTVFCKEYLNKILKKITFGKVSIIK